MVLPYLACSSKGIAWCEVSSARIAIVIRHLRQFRATAKENTVAFNETSTLSPQTTRGHKGNIAEADLGFKQLDARLTKGAKIKS